MYLLERNPISKLSFLNTYKYTLIYSVGESWREKIIQVHTHIHERKVCHMISSLTSNATLGHLSALEEGVGRRL